MSRVGDSTHGIEASQEHGAVTRRKNEETEERREEREERREKTGHQSSPNEAA